MEDTSKVGRDQPIGGPRGQKVGGGTGPPVHMVVAPLHDRKVEPQITKIRVSPPTNIHLLGIHEKATLNATSGQHNYMASYLTK